MSPSPATLRGNFVQPRRIRGRSRAVRIGLQQCRHRIRDVGHPHPMERMGPLDRRRGRLTEPTLHAALGGGQAGEGLALDLRHRAFSSSLATSASSRSKTKTKDIFQARQGSWPMSRSVLTAFDLFSTVPLLFVIRLCVFPAFLRDQKRQVKNIVPRLCRVIFASSCFHEESWLGF